MFLPPSVLLSHRLYISLGKLLSGLCYRVVGGSRDLMLRHFMCIYELAHFVVGAQSNVTPDRVLSYMLYLSEDWVMAYICYTVPQNHKTLCVRILVGLVQMGSSGDYALGDVEGALILRMQPRQRDRRGQGGLCAPALSHTPFHLLLYGSTRHLWHDESFCLLNWDDGSQEVKIE